MVTRPSESERLSLEEAAKDPRFQKVIDWIEVFLCAPNPEVGRAGDVCPFARAAVSKRSIDFFKNTSLSAAALAKEIERHLEDFRQDAASGDIYKSRIIVPTELDNAAEAVEIVQRQLKPKFVEQHFMLGQFFPDCQEPGLWSKSFRPLQAPVPLLAIRNMVPTDIAFLYDDENFVRAYLQRFGRRGEIALRHFEATRETQT